MQARLILSGIETLVKCLMQVMEKDTMVYKQLEIIETILQMLHIQTK